MWTEKERAIAKGLCEPETYAFLTKLFTAPEYDVSVAVVAKNIVALDDAEYGRMMKVAHMVKEDNKNRLKVLKTLSVTPTGKTVAIAPR